MDHSNNFETQRDSVKCCDQTNSNVNKIEAKYR